MKKVFLKNLGCPKNEVDGNILLGMLQKENLQATDIPEMADIIIVNSCGFIEPAKEESINEILSNWCLRDVWHSAIRQSLRGKCPRLILWWESRI